MLPLPWASDPIPIAVSLGESVDLAKSPSHYVIEAVWCVDGLYYLDDLDQQLERVRWIRAGHRKDAIDIAHVRWASSTAMTALHLCAAALGIRHAVHIEKSGRLHDVATLRDATLTPKRAPPRGSFQASSCGIADLSPGLPAGRRPGWSGRCRGYAGGWLPVPLGRRRGTRVAVQAIWEAWAGGGLEVDLAPGVPRAAPPTLGSAGACERETDSRAAGIGPTGCGSYTPLGGVWQTSNVRSSHRMGRRLTGLTPSDQLAAQCPTCGGDQRVLGWVAATYPDEDNPEITHGYHHPAVRDCPDCGGTGRVKFGS